MEAKIKGSWLRERDKNTKFFHSKALARNRKSRICELEDENSRWIEEVEEVEQMLNEHFTNIFTTTSPSHSQLNVASADLPAKVTGEMKRHMDQRFTEESCPNMPYESTRPR